jgi:hypothetical protein
VKEHAEIPVRGLVALLNGLQAMLAVLGDTRGEHSETGVKQTNGFVDADFIIANSVKFISCGAASFVRSGRQWQWIRINRQRKTS